MKLMVNLPLRGLRKVGGRRTATHYTAVLTAVRVIGPERLDRHRRGFLYVDVIPPDHMLMHLSNVGLQPDGTYRVSVSTNTNRKLLLAFEANGEEIWDVTEVA